MNKPDPLTSVVLTIPVFLVYHLGILLIDFRNGVDWVTGLTFELLERSEAAYIGVTVLLAAGLALVAYVQRRRGHVQPLALAPVLVEATLWAAVMLLGVGWASSRLVAALSVSSPTVGTMVMSPFAKVVMAAGAGFHEEVVFRALLLGGGLHLWAQRDGRVSYLAATLLCVVTALLFALAHHLGPIAEPVVMSAFTFRFVAGLFLAGLYLLRGFAVVVYTHTLYDMLVFFVFAG